MFSSFKTACADYALNTSFMHGPARNNLPLSIKGAHNSRDARPSVTSTMPKKARLNLTVIPDFKRKANKLARERRRIDFRSVRGFDRRGMATHRKSRCGHRQEVAQKTTSARTDRLWSLRAKEESNFGEKR
jgi:hypothetical protein